MDTYKLSITLNGKAYMDVTFVDNDEASATTRARSIIAGLPTATGYEYNMVMSRDRWFSVEMS